MRSYFKLLRDSILSADLSGLLLTIGAAFDDYVIDPLQNTGTRVADIVSAITGYSFKRNVPDESVAEAYAQSMFKPTNTVPFPVSFVRNMVNLGDVRLSDDELTSTMKNVDVMTLPEAIFLMQFTATMLKNLSPLHSFFVVAGAVRAHNLGTTYSPFFSPSGKCENWMVTAISSAESIRLCATDEARVLLAEELLATGISNMKLETALGSFEIHIRNMLDPKSFSTLTMRNRAKTALQKLSIRWATDPDKLSPGVDYLGTQLTGNNLATISPTAKDIAAYLGVKFV